MPKKKALAVGARVKSRHAKSTKRQILIQPGERNNRKNEKSKSFPIVGVGASAGGLEAFTQFLKNFPPEAGIATIFVQHQDPRHESSLPHLLTRTTSMAVVEVVEGMMVHPNHVYVIPPNTTLGIFNKVLHLQKRPVERTPHMPIDFLFRSLAEECKHASIGVLLSGTATDGTLGLQAIKAADGITFAQSPESAKYDGMPRNAIVSGCVDFVMLMKSPACVHIHM
jgi:two-component system, chemotaxis family, CheB/CheR fusion protein